MSTNTPPATPPALTEAEIEECALAGAIAVDRDETFFHDASYKETAITATKVALAIIPRGTGGVWAVMAKFKDAVLATAAAIRQRKQEPATRCIGRDPMFYGSRQCEESRTRTSDLCARHAAVIAPHQIINGVFYVGRNADEEG